jgi:protein arginine kinase activator
LEKSLSKAADAPAEEDQICPQCGMARRELYSQGQMGCAQCYQAFGAEVQQALKEIHGETRHLGKNAA